MKDHPRIAIVSDPLVQRGGAERFVEHLASVFPDAPVYAILYSSKSGPSSLAGRVRTSFLQRIPGAVSHHRAFLPLYPAAIESFDLSQYDVIISSHHTAAKGLLRNAEQRHICYCHTPMRALWERSHEELQSLPPLLRPAVAMMMGRLRTWDIISAARVDQFLANSEVTRTRIAKHYGRMSVVLYSPCTLDRFTPSEEPPQDYYLIASRNVPYKRIDIAVAAARMVRRKLVIAGCRSADFEGPHVEQLGHVSDRRLVELMRGAKAMLFPGYEDFGMAPVEMMACGRPVIAYGKGGVLETVVDGTTGVLVPEQSPQAFAQAMLRLERMNFDSHVIRKNAERFSKERFTAALRNIVYDGSPGNAAPSFLIPT